MDRAAQAGNAGLDELQERIGYRFRDINLLELALMHKSYANEQQLEEHCGNERLEFLGDAVIELVISHILMEQAQDSPEGRLSKMRASIVNTDSLAGISRSYALSDCLRLSRGEQENRGREKKSILANAYEALAAAVYFDGGYDAVFGMISAHFKPLIDEAARRRGYSRDYKSRLQELVQKLFNDTPVYEIISEQGPDHYKSFGVQVIINNQPCGTGRGGNKKTAEQQAAREALKLLESNHP
jgi:ribonuclease III